MNKARAISMCLVAGGATSIASAQILYNNGPLATTPTGACIPAGSASSQLQGTNTLLGSNMNTAGNFRMADNFTVPAGQAWTVNGINFFGYQTGASNPAPVSTFTAATLRLWYGPPNNGGTVVGGNNATNVMTATSFDSKFRHGACDLTRGIMKLTTSVSGGPVVLQPGTYWVDFSASGSAASGPWCPAVTVTGVPSPVGANAIQFNGTAWAQVFGAGTVNPQEAPFEVLGTSGVGQASGRCCYLDGTCDVTTASNCALIAGAIFAGNGTDCSGSPCVIPTGACCLPNGDCQILTQVNCTNAGGNYSGNNVTCAAANCPPGGACCFYLANSCEFLTNAACTARAGTWTSAGTLCANANCPLPPPGGDVYAFWANNAARPLLSWPVNAPVFNTVIPGVTPIVQTFAVDFAGNNNDLYCITNGAVGTQALGKIDVTTGFYTQIALITGAGAAEANWAGLAFDASTNTMFALAAANLYSVNLTTGVTTLVAPITGVAGGLLIDFSVNQSGTLMIAHDIGADRMFSIDKTTGVATQLAATTGYAANFAQGMDFDPVSGNLFATIFTGASAGGFCKVDTTTGACQTLANTGLWAPPNGPEMEMAIKGAPGVACYANCDGSTGTPRLTANDFQCFIDKYAANDPYANCDGSTGTPALTANDFQCFINKFAGGCS